MESQVIQRHRGLIDTEIETAIEATRHGLTQFDDSSSTREQSRLSANVDQFKSSSLPSLRSQITSLSFLLELAEIQMDPIGKLELVLQTLFNIRTTLEEIEVLFRADATRNSERIQVLPPFEHAPMKHVILFKTNRIISSMIYPQTYAILDLTRHFIFDVIDFMSGSVPQSYLRIMFHRKALTYATTACLLSIDELNEWIDKPNYFFVQQGLREGVDALGRVLQELTFRFRPFYQKVPPSDIKRKLAQMMVPILKLLRIFLKNLSGIKSNEESVTIMNLNQLSLLLGLVTSINDESTDLYRNFRINHMHEVDFSVFIDWRIRRLSKYIATTLTSVLIPYIESLPSIQPEEKDYQKNRFEMWFDQFFSATQRFITDLQIRL